MSDWMKKLTKNFGSIANELAAPQDDVIKFRSPSLNWSVSNGGITEGKAVCFYGPESAGKSMLAQQLLIEIQKKNPEAIVIWFDAEYSFNKDWFAKMGGDVNRCIVRQTNDPEKIFDFIYGEMYEMLQDGAPIKGIAIDSIKSICYPGDIKDKSTKITMGGSGAKYLGSALKRILPPIREFGVTTALIQQVYEEIDPMLAMANPYKIPDGRALKHFCDYMLEVTKIENKKSKVIDGKNIYGGDAQLGHKVRVKCKKNRTGAPARVAEFTFSYETGIINMHEEVFALAETLGIVYHPISETTGKPSMMFWQVDGFEKVKGKDNMIAMIRDNKDLYDSILAKCEGVDDSSFEPGKEIGIVNTDSVSIDLDSLDTDSLLNL